MLLPTIFFTINRPRKTRAHLQQSLQLRRLLVPQVEEAVAGVVRVQSQLAAVLAHPALGPHHERLTAPVAKLVLALGASEMHAAPSGEGVSELALRAVDAVLGEVLGHGGGLVLGVVGVLPLGELLTRDSFVLFLPLQVIQVLLIQIFVVSLNSPFCDSWHKSWSCSRDKSVFFGADLR